ncbi:MAG TPA: dienelactone hydrolase family protein [Gemmatimonadales bacterium]|nr:dienelactone hydrolase family protein [Gemmatimonadales bacterium]
MALAACGPKPAADQQAAATPTGPNVQTREVEYRSGEAVLKGYIAWDSARAGPRPGVLVVHEWWGHNEHVRNAARRLAEAGYVGFAVDMYGNGKMTAHPDTAQQFMNEALRDTTALLARFEAARQELLRDPHVDPERIGAIGYCFGGAVVLTEARRGADLDAVVTFHGAIPPGKIDSGAVKGRLLIQTGADDPMIPAAMVEGLRKSLTAAGAQFEIVTYPGAKHSFTNPRADSVGMPQLAYNADAAAKSWEAMLGLFRQVWP